MTTSAAGGKRTESTAKVSDGSDPARICGERQAVDDLGGPASERFRPRSGESGVLRRPLEQPQETLRGLFISPSTSPANVSIDRGRTELLRREIAVIVKILEVWFLSSVPIGIAVGKLLERSSAILPDGTLQLVRSVASTDR